jgi:transposase
MAGKPLENSLDKESRIRLAVSDYKKGTLASIKEAARVHGVAYGTVRDRLNGVQAKCNTIPRTRKLSVDQENALIKYILNLNSRGFPPKPRYVREMANALLAQDGDGKVGKNWVSSFVKRREELMSMFTRKYD